MNETFILDASALIAFLNDEEGADKVENILQRAKNKSIDSIYMNKLNVLEIFYGVYRKAGQDKANEVLEKVLKLPLIVIDVLSDDVFKEAVKER